MHKARAMDGSEKMRSPLPLPAVPGLEWDHVVCWVGSPEGVDPVFPVAQALAELHAGKCCVVMSLDGPGEQQQELRRGATGPLTPELIAAAESKLARQYRQAARTMVLPGRPVTEIRRYARNHRVDLVVMGEQALEVERVYGERLIDNAPCAVMVLLIPDEKPEPNTAQPNRPRAPADPPER